MQYARFKGRPLWHLMPKNIKYMGDCSFLQNVPMQPDNQYRHSYFYQLYC